MKKFIENLKKSKKILTIISLTILSLQPYLVVYAAEDPLSVINNLSDFIFSITRAVGIIIIVYGVVQIGLSFQSHDPSQKSGGVLAVVGGILIAFSKEIINTIMG